MKIAFIPARCGSKSIPFKNIKVLNGYPLIYWNLKALEHSSEIDKVVVATDCDRIADIVKGFGFKKAEVYFRDLENATDTASTESVMKEYIKKAELHGEDLFLLVQCTSPFTSSQHFDEAIALLSNGSFDSLLSVVKFKRFLWNYNHTPLNYDPTSRPRRQDFQGYLLENGAFYASSVKRIMDSGHRISGNIGTYIMPEYTALEIDEEEDWVVAEQLMKKYTTIDKNV